MSVKLITGTAASSEAFIDANGCLFTAESLPAWPAAGGYYTVAGQASAVVAASLAANTMLMSARFATGSTRKAYVTKFRVVVAAATLGATGGISGTIGIVRFTAQTPTGGTARTANRHGEALGTATDMTDIRDSNAALTGSAPTFGNVVASSLVPNTVVNNNPFEWIYEPNVPDILAAGDGLALRTLVAMPATQTWVYSYTMHWLEK